MSAGPPASPRLPSRPWWVAPAAGLAVAAGAMAVLWALRERPAAPPAQPGPPAAGGKALPLPDGNGAGLHSVTAGVENGVRVLKIRVTPGGDELIVDAATGRLLETRPAKAAGPAVKPKAQAP
jgi:hypothetical protein